MTDRADTSSDAERFLARVPLSKAAINAVHDLYDSFAAAVEDKRDIDDPARLKDERHAEIADYLRENLRLVIDPQINGACYYDERPRHRINLTLDSDVISSIEFDG